LNHDSKPSGDAWFPTRCPCVGLRAICLLCGQAAVLPGLYPWFHCLAPPRRRRRLCADHRVEPYACRCRCRRPRARTPLDRHHWLSQWSCPRCIEL
jgi:hypothetical protein